MGRGHVFVEGLAGVVVPGKLVVDHSLAVALGVLAPVWGKLRLYVHLMIGPSGSKGRTGAAAGLARTAAPDHGNFFAVTLVASRQPDGLPTRRFLHRQVGQGSCPWNPSTVIDGAMYWQPTMMETRRRASAQGIRVGPRAEGTFGCYWSSGFAITTDLLVRA